MSQPMFVIWMFVCVWLYSADVSVTAVVCALDVCLIDCVLLNFPTFVKFHMKYVFIHYLYVRL